MILILAQIFSFTIMCSATGKQADKSGLGYDNTISLVPLSKPTLYLIEADYECKSNMITKLHRSKYVQTVYKKCNEVSGQILPIALTASLIDNTTEELLINSTIFVDDYKGLRISASDGIIDHGSSCQGDEIVFFEVALPKLGNCIIGIFQHDSVLAFARIKGKCDSFCVGRVKIKYVTPLGNNFGLNDP